MRSTPIPYVLAAVITACSFGAGESPAVADAEAAEAPPPTVHEKVIRSQTYHLDKKYMSMTGPYGFNKTNLLESEQPELLWIVGYESKMVDAETGEQASQEFMCHANLDIDPREYFDDFPTAPSMSGRLFTLSQGQYRIDFPSGYGIPISSDMELSLATQVLNLNHEDIDRDLAHEVTIRFLRDSEVGDRPMTAMYQAAVEGFKALGDARYYGMMNTDVHDEDEFGPGCSVGQAAIAGDADNDTLGQQFTAHWVVEPGVEVNRTNVTRFLNLHFDTKAHYIAVHMHPFGKDLVLRDLTTKEVVYKAQVDNTTDRVGIQKVDFYSSTEGIPFYKGHEYELVSTYDNTSDQDADSMAVMYLYLVDPKFRKPKDLDRG